MATHSKFGNWFDEKMYNFIKNIRQNMKPFLGSKK